LSQALLRSHLAMAEADEKERELLGMMRQVSLEMVRGNRAAPVSEDKPALGERKGVAVKGVAWDS
jgi:hypothetical protein